MKKGDIYRIHKHKTEKKKYRSFVVVSRQALIDSNFSTIVCAPVYSKYEALSTQVKIGINEGLKKDSAIFCDNLISIDKAKLTNFVGTLNDVKLMELNDALKNSLDLF